MNILFVCAGLGGGGAEKVAVNLANTMSSKGEHVTIYYRPGGEAQNYKISPAVTLVRAYGYGLVKRIFNLKKLIDKSFFDAVISFTDTPNIDAYIALKLSRKKAVFIPTIHTNLAARDSKIKKSYYFYLIRHLHIRACDFADKIVAVSDGGKQSLLDYYNLTDSKATTIYNPVIADSEELACKYRNNNKEKIRLVAAGRLTKAKNYYLMIDSFSVVKDRFDKEVFLDIYGEGELKDDLQKYIDLNCLNESVQLKGFSEDLAAVFSQSDLFVFSSDWEGFGNVIVEALCAGIPVISTDCASGPREILADGKFGRLVPVGNVDAFSAAIEEEVNNPLFFSQNELRKHLENFREETVAQKYIDLVTHVKSDQA
ncbi:glycosyltransferase [uncultured Alcanivorax sp.]|uniref:glycosyltransferase n=1 Tax=uncultured Alcanivorax sp. TaxID=191215 RepID=UPI00260C24A6|nr:glycosyltransferase [uncultured Alcanivorax sp.]